MKPIVLLILGSFLCMHSLQAQKQKVFTFNVFFESDKFKLQESEKLKLEKLLDTLEYDRIKRINLFGHTDSRADSLYNVNLSAKRTTVVSDFLQGLDVPIEKIITGFFGENKPASENETDIGKQKNRRVEIHIVYLFPVPATHDKKDTVRHVVKDSCEGDTTLSYSTGIMLMVDKCNYKKLSNCVKVKTISNAEQIRAANVRMRDENGNELISDGMFELQWDTACGACGDFKCKWIMTEEEIKVAGFNFYSYNENTSAWNGLGKRRIKKIKIKGETFYEVELTCNDFDVWFNKDMKRPFPAHSKIKVAGRWQIVSVQSDNSARQFYYYPYARTEIIDSKKKWKRLPAKTDVYIVVSKKTGDTLHLPFADLSPRKFKPMRARLTIGYMEKYWPHLRTVKLTRNKQLLKTERLYYRKYKIKAKTIRRLKRNKKHDRILR